MRTTGYLLLIGGFLVAAYTNVLDVATTNWARFLPAAMVAIIGVITIKRQARGHARSEQVLTANRAELGASLGRIVRDLEQISAEAESLSTTALRHAIDERLRDDLRRFADARESLIHLYGLQAYADILSDFAAGERYVNRVWSAAADDYEAEARCYIDRALERFRTARSRLESAGRVPA